MMISALEADSARYVGKKKNVDMFQIPVIVLLLLFSVSSFIYISSIWREFDSTVS